jgi:hypothetical protein
MLRDAAAKLAMRGGRIPGHSGLAMTDPVSGKDVENLVVRCSRILSNALDGDSTGTQLQLGPAAAAVFKMAWPQLKSVSYVDSPDPRSQPTDCGWHSGACHATAIDLSQGRSAQCEDGHRAEGETRQREHRPGA